MHFVSRFDEESDDKIGQSWGRETGSEDDENRSPKDNLQKYHAQQTYANIFAPPRAAMPVMQRVRTHPL